MIETHVDVKITGAYLLRLFGLAFSEKLNNQIWKTSYAQHQEVCKIWKKKMENHDPRAADKQCERNEFFQ